MAENTKALMVGSQGVSNDCRFESPRIGRIEALDGEGRTLVDFEGNPKGAIPARLTSSAKERLARGDVAGRDVLLIFENGDPERPVIIDTLYSLVDEMTLQATDRVKKREEEPAVDRQRLFIDAEQEIVIRCGEASISLTRAGKIIIRGTYVLSRSSGAQRIKGASVQIN